MGDTPKNGKGVSRFARAIRGAIRPTVNEFEFSLVCGYAARND
jgi:hypothetical protein